MLGDFGLMKNCPETMVRITSAAGTCGYLAPEIFKSQDCKGTLVNFYKADIYALGYTFEVVAHLYRQEHGSSNLIEHIETLADKMTAKDPNRRPGLQFIMETLKAYEHVSD